jgi:hypothetical protein
MANSSTESGATPASHGSPSLLSRFIGIVTSPKATFEAVVAHPKWLGMLALVTIIVAAGVSLPLMTEAGRRAQLDQQVDAMESFGVQVTDEAYARMEQGTRMAAITTFISILVVGPLMSLIIAGILFGVFTALMGGQASFKQLFAVYVHSTAITAVAQIFMGPLNYFRGSMASATNLAVLLPMIDERSFLGRLFGMIDLFWIWWLILLAIGLGVLYKRRTQSVAYGLFGIYAVCIVLLAAGMSMFGRS